MNLKIKKSTIKSFLAVAGCYLATVMAAVLGSELSKYTMYGIVIGVAALESFTEKRMFRVHKQCPFIWGYTCLVCMITILTDVINGGVFRMAP